MALIPFTQNTCLHAKCSQFLKVLSTQIETVVVIGENISIALVGGRLMKLPFHSKWCFIPFYI